MQKLFKEYERIFTLRLADGINWGFVSTKSTDSWLEEFAKILQLKEAADGEKIDRKLVFLALKNDNSEFLKNYNSHAQGKVYRLWSHTEIPENFIELNLDFLGHEEICYINMAASLKLIFRYYAENGGGAVHATFAEYKGKGFLIAAQGGTGKSTCYNRLPRNDKWIPFSDDNALLVKVNEKFMVHPMPTWSDHLLKRGFTTFQTPHHSPLSAIFFLEQAQSDEVVSLKKHVAVQRVYESFKQIWENYWERIDKAVKIDMNRKIFHSAADIANTLPCYDLKATLHGSFWQEIEKVMCNS